VALPAAPDREQHDDPLTGTPSEATPEIAPGTATRRGQAALRWAVLGVLAAVILASLGYLGTRVVRDGTGSGWGRVSSAFSADDSLQGERDAAMSQARQFALRVNTYGPDLLDAQSGQMPKYRSQVEAVVTAKFRTDFEKSGVPLAEATVSQAGIKRTAQVYATGVAAIDSDTATVLVAGSFTNSYPKKKGSTKYVAAAPSPYRFEVSMVRTGGKWLVDSFTPVEKAESSSSSGSSDTTGGAAQ
jgi:Mce-associated membrane protein